MTSVRYPAVAGTFYPDDPVELGEMVHQFLAASKAEGVVPKAIIVPHSGYIYSGPVAAEAFRLLLPVKDKIKRVIILGVAGLLLAARKHGLKAKTLDLRNSSDTAGSKDQAVGYGAYVLF